jgi:energy-coupling factor transporter transmembrane protein EcfT
MDEKPKNIWKKSWTGWRGLLLWFILFFAIFLFWLAVASTNLPFAWLFAIGLSLVGVLLVACIRWIFCWRNFKRFLFDLACFATLIALFYAEEGWRGKHDWEKFKRDWEAKGEKFDLKDFVPPPVPDDQNFALTPIMFTSYGSMLTRDGKMIPYKDRDTNFVDQMKMNVAHNDDWPKTSGNWQTAKMSDLTGWQNYYRSLAATTNEFPVAPQSQTPAQDVLLALSKYDPTIEELREASQLPYSRFPLEYDKEDPSAILLPHLADLKRSSQVLQLRALAELQNGQSERALDDVKLSLRLADSIHTEPILISHLVRAAILNLTLQPIYEGLAEHKWSDAQLVELDSELAKLDFLAGYELSMRGEMVLFQGGNFDYLRRHPAQLINLSGDFGVANPPLPGRIVSWLIPSGWFYQNQLHCARPMVEFYLPAADMGQKTISPAKIRAADAAIDADTKRPTPNNIIERMLLPALGTSAKKIARTQSSVDLARVAIALERHRLAHGEFPESLEALAPQFITKVPHDIINGQPLHYRRTDDGQFILYSVGWNERDDGGSVVFGKGKTPVVDISEGDWVWRYPQK